MVSQELLKVLIPTASALLVPFLSVFVPRLWQDNLRRLQAEAETRLKRLEAVEKGLSVLANARTNYGIDVSPDDLRHELQRIVHEFADPAVLSREALEDWANKPLTQRLQALARPPRFTVPADYARGVRWRRYSGPLVLIMGLVWQFATYFYLGIADRDLSLWLGPAGFLYCSLVYIITQFLTYRALRAALKVLRSMPERQIVEMVSFPSGLGSIDAEAGANIPEAIKPSGATLRAESKLAQSNPEGEEAERAVLQGRLWVETRRSRFAWSVIPLRQKRSFTP